MPVASVGNRTLAAKGDWKHAGSAKFSQQHCPWPQALLCCLARCNNLDYGCPRPWCHAASRNQQWECKSWDEEELVVDCVHSTASSTGGTSTPHVHTVVHIAGANQHKRVDTNQHCWKSSRMGTAVGDIQLAVCGLHMRGQKLEHQLTDLGATFYRNCRSSPVYELYALTDSATGVCKPGMIAVGHGKGKAIELDIWNLPVQQLGQFFMQIPPPLGLGTVFLEDGSTVKGFICEGYIASLSSSNMHTGDIDMPGQATLKVENITQHMSWKQYTTQ